MGHFPSWETASCRLTAWRLPRGAAAGGTVGLPNRVTALLDKPAVAPARCGAAAFQSALRDSR